MYQSYGSPSQYGMAGSYGSATPQQPSAPQHQGPLNQVTSQLISMHVAARGAVFEWPSSRDACVQLLPPQPLFSAAKQVLLCE